MDEAGLEVSFWRSSTTSDSTRSMAHRIAEGLVTIAVSGVLICFLVGVVSWSPFRSWRVLVNERYRC